MKCFIYMLAFASMIIACKKAETKPVADSPYPNIVVGHAANGGYVVENAAVIKTQWQSKFKSSIDSLQIIKSVITDKVPVTFYALVAKTTDGSQLATVLTEKNKDLFFDVNGTIISCKSKTNKFFEVKGISQEGHIRLYCADCADCEKTEYGF